MSYVALVIGSTGAVGRDLVAELVASAKCAKVIALARREVPESAWSTAFPALDVAQAQSKLEVRTVDFEQLGSAPHTVVRPEETIDAAFSCLGTTRKDAGSAEAFRKVDLEYTVHFAELAKAAHAPYCALLTAMYVDKSSWLLYSKTKAEAEARITQLGFARTSFFRPGLIDRGELMRPRERLWSYILPIISTRTIARSMVADYESGTTGAREWTDAAMKAVEAERQ